LVTAVRQRAAKPHVEAERTEGGRAKRRGEGKGGGMGEEVCAGHEQGMKGGGGAVPGGHWPRPATGFIYFM